MVVVVVVVVVVLVVLRARARACASVSAYSCAFLRTGAHILTFVRAHVHVDVRACACVRGRQ